MKKKILHLHLCFKYFDEIKAGTKPEEFRDAEKWQHKLDTGNYTDIRLWRAYEKKSPETIIDLPYKGYKLKTITHPHFKNVPTLVCAIDVTGYQDGDVLSLNGSRNIESTTCGIVTEYKGRLVNFYGQDCLGIDCFDEIEDVIEFGYSLDGNIHTNEILKSELGI